MRGGQRGFNDLINMQESFTRKVGKSWQMRKFAVSLRSVFFNPERQLRNGWWFMVFFLVLAMLLAPALLLAHQLETDLGMAAQALLILAASWICQRVRQQPMAEVLGTLNARWVKELAVGAALGAGLMLAPALLLASLGVVSWQRNPDALATLATGLALCAWVAIAEEVLFRGFIFQRLQAGLGVWPAQVLLAGWFLLTHLNNPGMVGNVRLLAGVNIFLASIMFGLALLRTRSLAMPIGLHFAANWVQGSVLGFGVSGTSSPGLLRLQLGDAPAWLTGGEFGLEASAPGLVFVIIVIGLLSRQPAPRAAAGEI